LLQIFLNHKKELLQIIVAHFLLVLLFFIVGYSEINPKWIDSHGYSKFASDSFACHDQALELKRLVEKGEYTAWWNVRSRFHTRAASLMYFSWGRLTGCNVLALWPINCLLLLLCWLSWKYLIVQLGGRSSSHPVIWIAFPILWIHFAQLLRDPYYITFFILWLNAWVYLFRSDNKKSMWKAAVTILLISPFLYWVRDRFWVLAQLISISYFFFAFILFIVKKKSFFFVKMMLLLCIAINAYSVIKMINRSWTPEQVQTESAEGLINKPFTFFYKVAFLRKNFIKSYDQASSLDADVQFESDADVVAYVPRALQIGMFMPFPNMWFEHVGKTGLLGRMIAAWEMVLMSLLMLMVVFKALSGKMKLEMFLCLIAITISCLALGLVVTNGGALYRMRLSSWLIWGALCFALYFPSFTQNDSVKLKVSDKKTGE